MKKVKYYHALLLLLNQTIIDSDCKKIKLSRFGMYFSFVLLQITFWLLYCLGFSIEFSLLSLVFDLFLLSILIIIFQKKFIEELN